MYSEWRNHNPSFLVDILIKAMKGLGIVQNPIFSKQERAMVSFLYFTPLGYVWVRSDMVIPWLSFYHSSELAHRWIHFLLK